MCLAIYVLLKISEAIVVVIFVAIGRIIGVKVHFTFPSIRHTILIDIKANRA